MPDLTDARGHTLRIGDTVVVPCVITAIQPGHLYENVQLSTAVPIPIDGSQRTLSLNAAQIIRDAEPTPTDAPPPVPTPTEEPDRATV